jgi:glycosyltransferase involved in cell wall biosynthesis
VAVRRERDPLLADRVANVAVRWAVEWTPEPTSAFGVTGAQVAAAAWTRALARYGQVRSADIFVPYGAADACRRYLEEIPSGTGRGEAPALGLFHESELCAQLRAKPYDVLHEPGTEFPALSYARSSLSDRVIPITCSQHGISYTHQLYSFFFPQLTAQVYPCDAIVCLTVAAREAMQKRLVDVADRYCRVWDRSVPPLPRLEVIPWGVDTELFAPTDPALARRALDLPMDRPIVLCIGRVRIEDKMDWTPPLLAFERLARSAKQRPLFVLAGAAGSDYSNQVIAQARQLGLGDDLRTFFNLPPACLPSLYAASDVVLCPTDSPSESFGLTVVEAMACGRPVVASDWDGYKELIVHGETGFKVRTDWADCLGDLEEVAPLLPWDQQHLHVGQSVSVDVRQMTTYLSQLVHNADLRREMGLRSRQRVEANYAWPAVIDRWSELWEELNAIARTITVQERAHLGYLRPNYFAHFHHYASRIVDDTTLVRLTQRGKEWVAAESPLYPHVRTHDYLRPQHLRAAMAALRTVDWIRVGTPVGKLVEALTKHHGLSRHRALMHVMWLAKYDLVSLCADE